MESTELVPKQWYWVRRPDGSIAPYIFHQLVLDKAGKTAGQFFVGSFITTFRLSQVLSEAKMATFETNRPA